MPTCWGTSSLTSTNEMQMLFSLQEQIVETEKKLKERKDDSFFY